MRWIIFAILLVAVIAGLGMMVVQRLNSEPPDPVTPPTPPLEERVQRNVGRDFPVEFNAILRGRVTNAAGEPLVGAPVELNFYRDPDFVPKTETDADGRYEFTGLPRGEYHVATSYPGLELKRIETTTTLERVREHDFVLRPLEHLRGRVVDARDRGIPGAYVRLNNGKVRETGPGGVFECAAARAEAYVLVARHPDYHPWIKNSESLEELPTTILLLPLE